MKLEKIYTTTGCIPLPYMVRTCFDDELWWKQLCEDAIKSYTEHERGIDDFCASVEFINHKEFENYELEQLLPCLPDDYDLGFLFIVDRETFTNKERPILCVNLREESYPSFRVMPDLMWCIENNLSLSNLDFEDFLSSVDQNGLYRRV